METIKIKYFDNEIDRIEKISKGDWIDLRSAETIHLKKGEFHLEWNCQKVMKHILYREVVHIRILK